MSFIGAREHGAKVGSAGVASNEQQVRSLRNALDHSVLILKAQRHAHLWPMHRTRCQVLLETAPCVWLLLVSAAAWPELVA